MAKFEMLAGYLRDQIHSGQLKAGERIPSITRLKEMFNVSYGTVRSAMLVLKAENLVTGHQGIGVVVADRHAKVSPASPRA